MIALQYHEVKLKFTFEDVDTIEANAALEVWGDYIYLDTDERRRFAQVSHEYLIEQVQMQEGITLAQSVGQDIHFRNKLRFNHPVKELIWTCENLVGDTGTQMSSATLSKARPY